MYTLRNLQLPDSSILELYLKHILYPSIVYTIYIFNIPCHRKILFLGIICTLYTNRFVFCDNDLIVCDFRKISYLYNSILNLIKVIYADIANIHLILVCLQ